MLGDPGGFPALGSFFSVADLPLGPGRDPRGRRASSAGSRGRAQPGVPSCPRWGTGAGGAAGPGGRREGPRELSPPPRRACQRGPRPRPRRGGGGSRAGERQGTVFEEADAVGDARGFLKGTGHDRAPLRGDARGGRSGAFPPRLLEAAWGAPRAPGGSTSAGRPRQRAPRFRLDRLGLLYKMPQRAEGRSGARRRGRWGPTCAPPHASGVASEPTLPLRAPACPGTLAPRHLARLSASLAAGVCTLKHLFNIKEAACAAVIVRRERVARSCGAVNESSPRWTALR